MTITFQKANKNHQKMIFEWLEEPHMKEFWDNSQEHKDDILNFIDGRKTPSHYFNGIFTYWIGLTDNQPFAFILTSEMDPSQTDIDKVHRKHLSKSGKTISIDFGIGNPEYIGKGLASKTLGAFVEFYHSKIDSQSDTFFIDPDENNPRAKHVYEKAGFKEVGEFDQWNGSFKGSKSYLMVKYLFD